MPKVLYFPNFLFDFPDQIYLEDKPESSETTLNRNRFYRLLLQDILSALNNNTTVDQHLLVRAKLGGRRETRALDSLLLEMGRDVTRRVFSSWDKIFNKKISEKTIKLHIEKDDSGSCFIRFVLEDSDGLFNINDRSLGFRWFFVFLLLTEYRGFRDPEQRDILFLFDEPASNLHSSAQSQLLESFGRLAQNCSIIYTTHSHHLINPDWLETTYVVKNGSHDVASDMTEYHANKTDITIDPDFPYGPVVSM